MKRKNVTRKELVANYLQCDIASVRAYQPGRFTLPIFTDGTDYVMVVKPTESGLMDVSMRWIEVQSKVVNQGDCRIFVASTEGTGA